MEKNNVSYTNEKLAKKFKSSFELVNYAILMAEEKIRSGRDSHAIDSDNLVITVMKDLAAGKDILIPIIISPTVVEVLKIEQPNGKIDLSASEGVKKAKRKIIKAVDGA